MSSIIRMLLFGFGAAGIVGGPYILYLAFTRPKMFPKPKLAKWQGAIAFVIGLVLIVIMILFTK